MRNLKLYYLIIIFPLPLLFMLAYLKENIFFVFFLFAYLIYRHIVDGSRLYSLGKINREDLWKTNLFMYQIKYFKSLYLKSI